MGERRAMTESGENRNEGDETDKLPYICTEGDPLKGICREFTFIN